MMTFLESSHLLSAPTICQPMKISIPVIRQEIKISRQLLRQYRPASSERPVARLSTLPSYGLTNPHGNIFWAAQRQLLWQALKAKRFPPTLTPGQGADSFPALPCAHPNANAFDLPQRSLLRRYAEGNFQRPLALARITYQPLAVLALEATGKKLPNIFRKLQR